MGRVRVATLEMNVSQKQLMVGYCTRGSAWCSWGYWDLVGLHILQVLDMWKARHVDCEGQHFLQLNLTMRYL